MQASAYLESRAGGDLEREAINLERKLVNNMGGAYNYNHNLPPINQENDFKNFNGENFNNFIWK